MKEEIPQLYAMCGRGARSTLRVLRPGLAATEIAVSPLPGNPTGIWTIKRSYADDFDAYIIVAFTNATLVSRKCSRRSVMLSYLERRMHGCLKVAHIPHLYVLSAGAVHW